MDKTCFMCFGPYGRDNTLVYHEIPRKARGEEFFMCFAPSTPDFGPTARKLFRNLISASRLGHPVEYFRRVFDLIREIMGDSDREAGFLSDSLIVILLRRDNEVFLMMNESAKAFRKESDGTVDGLAEELEEQEEIPIAASPVQADLFVKAIEDCFRVKRFTMRQGEHTVVFVPSRDFISRNREMLRDTIFFPSFEVPSDEGIEVDADLTFPAMHWKIGGVPAVRRHMPKRSWNMIRRWVPIAAGVLATLAAVLFIFNPFGWRNNEGASEGTISPAAEESVTGGAEGATEKEFGELPSRESTEEKRGEGVGDYGSGASLVLQEGWKKKFNAPVTSSPAVCVDLVVFGCRDGNLYAFSVDGTMRWKYESGQGIGASPICTGEKAICGDYSGTVFCLESSSGAVAWKYETGEKIVSSPATNGDMVVVGTTEGTLAAISVREGIKVWSQKIGESVWASPTVTGDFVIAATTDGSLLKMDLGGRVLWKVKSEGSIYSSPLCLPESDIVVFGSGDKFVYAYSLSEGSLMWRFAGGSEMRGSPSSDGMSIYAGSEDGILYAISLGGLSVWKKDMGAAVRSKPLVIGEMVFVTTYNAELTVLNAATGGILGEYRVESPVYSSPAGTDDMVFFGTNHGFFHAVSARRVIS